ncbi:MAG: GerW family sporulation protein [Lachnospiraceae bacterium]|nr:GerW family sporulation protein [Lachnospiraceae bacterium]
MAQNNDFESTVGSLFNGMTNFMTTKTVVGDAIHIGDTIILPLVDVSFGMGAGAKADGSKNGASGGMGGKMSPSAVLVIKDGTSRIVNIKNQDTVTKLVDMIPDIINRFTAMVKKDKENDLSDQEIVEVVKTETTK